MAEPQFLECPTVNRVRAEVGGGYSLVGVWFVKDKSGN